MLFNEYIFLTFSHFILYCKVRKQVCILHFKLSRTAILEKGTISNKTISINADKMEDVQINGNFKFQTIDFIIIAFIYPQEMKMNTKDQHKQPGYTVKNYSV